MTQGGLLNGFLIMSLSGVGYEHNAGLIRLGSELGRGVLPPLKALSFSFHFSLSSFPSELSVLLILFTSGTILCYSQRPKGCRNKTSFLP